MAENLPKRYPNGVSRQALNTRTTNLSGLPNYLNMGSNSETNRTRRVIIIVIDLLIFAIYYAKLCLTIENTREGVVNAYCVASQHPDLDWSGLP